MTNRKIKLENKTLFISCIVPAHNEQAVIGKFLPALCQMLQTFSEQYEVIVVDDGSKDETVATVLQVPYQHHIKVISLSRNFGKEIALTAGLEYAQGEVVIIIDGDFQHPLEILPLFFTRWAEGYDMIYGVREHRNDEAFMKRLFSHFFYGLLKRMTKTDIPANAGDYRLLDRVVVNAINRCEERNRFMKGLYGWVGYKSIGVPFQVQERLAGKSSWNFNKLLELAITGITSFSTIPLRIWSFIGFVISALALAYALYTVIDTLVYGVITPGFPTLIVAILFLGGIQLLSIGILGEYIGRIFDEVKKRPQYIVARKFGFDDDNLTT